MIRSFLQNILDFFRNITEDHSKSHFRLSVLDSVIIVSGCNNTHAKISASSLAESRSIIPNSAES